MIIKNFPIIKLIINSNENYHVSLDTVNEFEQTILKNNTSWIIPLSSNKILKKTIYLFWRIKEKYLIKIRLFRYFNTFYRGLFKMNKHKHYFAVLMGEDWYKCFPYFLFNSHKSIYLFDAWPNQQKSICKFINNFNIDNVFLSSSQATQMFKATNIKSHFYWVPEGIQQELYKHCPYDAKDIDVLALGRRYDKYHYNIVDFLDRDGKIYLYEKKKGEIIFPTRNNFIDGLARTKISICVPSSMTHPERSGNIETMTIRYLQSIVSKCLILGYAPKEMIDLFGYNPLIEIDMKNSVRQMQSILNNFYEYIPLIEKNYETVLNNHTWNHRWQQILSLLK